MRGPAITFGLVLLCVGCATVTREQQAFVLEQDGFAVAQPLPCSGAATGARARREAEPLPGPTIRVLSWNLHKSEDAGWDEDLARFAAQADVLMIQEAALTSRLRDVLESAGFDWILGSAFRLYDRRVTGVLNAARVKPAAACAQRFFEPLLRLPKATVITRYAVRGIEGTLAVANVHSINFSLALGDYQRQLEAIADELANHRGPIVLAGDFNSWSPARLEVVEAVARRMQLTPVVFENDVRSRFLGVWLDYLFVRDLEVVSAEVPVVRSSDHNPVRATLRVRGRDR